ncbi:MAG: hypothetical protein MRY64_01320 [Hyphomonadaceae bacterium]|nr:hypothetical protein [Hyphomonadaceae bacterium]
METGLALGALVSSVAACSSTNLEYTARVPAGAAIVAEYQEVAVDQFRGPEGYWYTDMFERMVADARFDGAPWFQMASSYDDPEAVFRGYVDIDWVDEDHERNIVSRCVEWDGPFDCETRRDVVQHCIRYEVHLAAEPELVDRDTGRVVWRGRYPGSAADRECRDVGYADETGHGPWDEGSRRYHGPGFGVGGFGSFGFGGFSNGRYIIDELVREALLDTLRPIRADIAPRNVRARARLIDEAVDPEVQADPRFDLAVQAARDNDVAGSCALWRALAADYPNAPAVKFNTGACLEAAGQYAEAHRIYSDVSLMPIELPDTVHRALSQIERRRSGEAEIERLMAPDVLDVPES